MSILKQKIIEKIKTEGPINFETFMEMALYHPELGYYMRDITKIGKSGDFYTSPHLHSIFGAMLGRQMEEMQELLGKNGGFHIVEMGAGMGYLAKDILWYLQKRGKLDQFEYNIVEMNPFLRQFQQNMLRDYLPIVKWFSKIKELPLINEGCFLSNELLDSFPVRLVEMDEDLAEIYLTVSDIDLAEIKKPCSEKVIEYFKEFSIDLSPMQPYRTEVNLRIKDWLKEVNKRLKEGFILTIDYGYPSFEYYCEERNRGTLLCYYHHEVVEDPYINIGEQDITAHVNFSALSKWGSDLGLETIGFCPQGTYLISLGIDEVMTKLYGESDSFEIAKIKGLIFPEGMGESHKVLIQYKGEKDLKLRGFDMRNQKRKL